MSGHQHGRGCEGDENHDDSPEMGVEYSLYSKIDLENMECLNEKIENSGKDVFKAWEDRLNFEKYESMGTQSIGPNTDFVSIGSWFVVHKKSMPQYQIALARSPH
uniref:PITH domain-containing protein n=1 Tax=Timema poppense TaxID=170557 RepID=A0A7R9H3M5_TIMPO|nr:unnamed protein product [Timema poppensis]